MSLTHRPLRSAAVLSLPPLFEASQNQEMFRAVVLKKGLIQFPFLSFSSLCRSKQSLFHTLSLLFSVGFLVSEMDQLIKKFRAFYLFRLWQKNLGSSEDQWWHLRPQQGTNPIRFSISANQCCVLMPLTLLQFSVQFIQFYLVIIELGS